MGRNQEKAQRVLRDPQESRVERLFHSMAAVMLSLVGMHYVPSLQHVPWSPLPALQVQIATTPRLAAAASGSGRFVAAPRMNLIDTLARRGTEAESEVNNAFYSPDLNAERVDAYKVRVERINAMEDAIEQLDDTDLAAKTAEFRKRLQAGETEDGMLEEVFAVVREAAWRTLELRHYDVQLVGAMALNDGMLAQMGTGEGKTLVATCAIYLNALSGKGAFVVTVNDYLARRDSELMGQVYSFLGLRVGLLQQGMNTAQRKAAYSADVTYVTNSELGFDYLRDHLAMTPAEVVLPPTLNFCVIDEGDSVLVDEARVPLIISGRTDAPVEKYEACAKLAATLIPGEHYDVFEKEQTIGLKEAGTKYCEEALQVDDLYDPTNPWASYVSNSIKAKELFMKEKEYIVKDGEALIVDEFSGRVMDGRRWGDGLHQAIEAKESLTVQPETEVVAAVTYQSLFRRFDVLSSMSGTAITEAEEFATIYKLDVLTVPPVLPRQRVDLPNAVYKSVKGKSNAALDELMGMHRSGRPVLVGTTSVEASQAFSDKLRALEVKHEVLNAKPESIQREAEIIGQAGRKGAVTIATNMAGRGTDILLGGSPSAMARLRVREALAAAAAIPVPTVASDFYPCDLNEDSKQWLADAAAQYATEVQVAAIKAATASDAPAPSGEDALAENLRNLDEMLAVASSAVPVIEGSATDLAREAYESIKELFDGALADEKLEVAQLGGLHVIGTNLHDSRRVDDQLRGRSGRQGDPGSTHFFLSLEDRIFRIFGGDKVKGVLDFLRVPEDQEVTSERVTETVKDVQEKVERYYYELRKGLFSFDEVLAVQREATYRERDATLMADADASLERVRQDSAEVVRDIFRANWKADLAAADGELASTLLTKLEQFFPQLPITVAELSVPRADAEAAAVAAATKAVDEKAAALDGIKAGLGFESARYLSLMQRDNLWKSHMKAMGFVKDFAGLKVYAQQDPLDVYREEGLKLFEKMQVALRQNTVFSFFAYQPK